MADQDSLMQNIDKVSYAVAAVVGLGILAVPLLSGEDLATNMQDLADKVQAVRGRIAEQRDPPVPPTRELRVVLTEQWSAKPGDEDTRWLAERIPIVIRKQAEEAPEPAVHEAGIVERIEFLRDPQKKKPFLRIVGKMGAGNKWITIGEVKLYRRATVDGKPGDLEEVKGFQAAGDFQYDDYEIEAGKQYSYFFSTQAASTDLKRHPISNTQAKSEELGPTQVVPFDVHLKFSFVRELPEGPVVPGRKQYWDYATGKLVRDRSAKTYKEGDALDSAGRWVVRRILPGAGFRQPARVDITDKLDPLAQHRLTPRSRRAVAGWEPMTAAGAVPQEPPDAETEPAADEKGPAVGEETPKKKVRTAKKSKKDSSGGTKKTRRRPRREFK